MTKINKKKQLDYLKKVLLSLNKSFEYFEYNHLFYLNSFQKLSVRQQNTLQGDKMRHNYKTSYNCANDLCTSIDIVERAISQLKQIKP